MIDRRTNILFGRGKEATKDLIFFLSVATSNIHFEKISVSVLLRTYGSVQCAWAQNLTCCMSFQESWFVERVAESKQWTSLIFQSEQWSSLVETHKLYTTLSSTQIVLHNNNSFRLVLFIHHKYSNCLTKHTFNNYCDCLKTVHLQSYMQSQ